MRTNHVVKKPSSQPVSVRLVVDLTYTCENITFPCDRKLNFPYCALKLKLSVYGIEVFNNPSLTVIITDTSLSLSLWFQIVDICRFSVDSALIMKRNPAEF